MSATRLLLATANPDKAREMAQLLSGTGLALLSRADFPDLPEVEEDADTFTGNAVLKARVLSDTTGLMALGDDSGLCVDALSGAPGVHSARYAGPGCSYRDNNDKLLAALADVPDGQRAARFVCAVAIVVPDHEPLTFEGTCEGVITRAPAGDKGFGYDPLFAVPETGLTFAEMDADTKARYSHRGKAFQQARTWLAERFGSARSN